MAVGREVMRRSSTPKVRRTLYGNMKMKVFVIENAHAFPIVVLKFKRKLH